MTPLGWLGRKTSTQTILGIRWRVCPKTRFRMLGLFIIIFCWSITLHIINRTIYPITAILCWKFWAGTRKKRPYSFACLWFFRCACAVPFLGYGHAFLPEASLRSLPHFCEQQRLWRRLARAFAGCLCDKCSFFMCWLKKVHPFWSIMIATFSSFGLLTARRLYKANTRNWPFNTFGLWMPDCHDRYC